MEQMCVLKGCTKIMLLISESIIKAREFFEKNGFDGTVSKGFKSISGYLIMVLSIR